MRACLPCMQAVTMPAADALWHHPLHSNNGQQPRGINDDMYMVRCAICDVGTPCNAKFLSQAWRRVQVPSNAGDDTATHAVLQCCGVHIKGPLADSFYRRDGTLRPLAGTNGMWVHNACFSRQLKRKLSGDFAASTSTVTPSGEQAELAAAPATPPSGIYTRARAASRAIQDLHAALQRAEAALQTEQVAHAQTAATAEHGAQLARDAADAADVLWRAEKAELVKVQSAVVSYMHVAPGEAYNKIKSLGTWLQRTEARFPGGMYALAKQMRFMEQRFGMGWEGTFERRLKAMEEARKELDIAQSTKDGLQAQLASASMHSRDLVLQLQDAHNYAAQMEEQLQVYRQGAMDELLAAQLAQISGCTEERADEGGSGGGDEDEEWLPPAGGYPT